MRLQLTIALALVLLAGQAAGPDARTTLSLDLIANGGSSPCPGDFNDDGMVDFADFLVFAAVYGTSSSDADYNARVDMDGSGRVDLSDFWAFAGVFGTTCPTPAPPPVSIIPDDNLRAVIADGLGKPHDAVITRAEMASLMRLKAPNSDISDLTGLEFATGLTYLDLGWDYVSGASVNNNEISDLSPLSGLTDLTALYLSGSEVSDLSPLAGLTHLKALYLSGNEVSDLSPLTGLTDLTTLHIAYNEVSDLSPLSDLTNLKALYLSGNEISDLSPLTGLTDLEWLGLTNNGITDVSALTGLTNLQWLHLDNNRISDLAPLMANRGLGASDEVLVRGNPLSATSINTHIPTLEAREVRVAFDEVIVIKDPRIHNDNLFVLPVAENLAAGNLPLKDYATRFYAHFSDAFDFLIFLPSLSSPQLDPEAFQGAYYAAAGNDVDGIGKRIFFDAGWGSAGKLQGVVYFSSASRSNSEHSPLVGGPMLHELMHRWANYIVAPSPHWAFTSADGILGGFDIATLVDHGGGRYSAKDIAPAGWARNSKPYSPIELYLAALIPPEEVPDLWVAEDGEYLRDEKGGRDGKSFLASRVKTYTIEDIIAEHGPRVLDHSQSQRNFRAAVILLVGEDYPANRKLLETLSNDASLFSHPGEDQFDEWYNFFEATGGRAAIAMDGLSQLQRRSGAKVAVPLSFGTPPPPIVCDWH